jgi:ribonuclease HI
MNISNILVQGDSKLVINQMNKVYKVKAVNLIPLYESCKKISDKVKEIKYEHIYRNLNKRADELSNIALDEDHLLDLASSFNEEQLLENEDVEEELKTEILEEIIVKRPSKSKKAGKVQTTTINSFFPVISLSKSTISKK